jgi:hypothetical protein
MRWRVQPNFIRVVMIASLPIVLCSCALRAGGLDADLLGLLPKPGELSEFRPVSAPHLYEPDNLWQYIDGAADLYLLYGFRKLITTEYAVGADSNRANVEIYCMESPMHAFGIYAAERSRDEQPVAIGVQGQLGPDVLNFYKGPYYAKMISFAPSKDASASLAQMGRSIADKIPGEFTEPEMFRYFPVENRVNQSERYIPTNFLGQSYLENGYRCDYASDQGSYQVFLVPLESDTAAQAVLKKYRLFLESQDYGIVHQGDDDVVIGEKQYFTLAFACRSYFGGVLNVKSQKEGLAVIEKLIRNLPK